MFRTIFTNRCMPALPILLIASFAVLPNEATAQETPLSIRVLSYNIHHGEGTDGKVDLERLAAVIRSANPDLVALQEVDNRTQRTGQIDQTARLAELTGMHAEFCKQLDYEGGDYGQAVLSRFPISESTIHWLPGIPDRERRIAAEVTVVVGEQKLKIVTTHLHHNNTAIRMQQASALNEIFMDHKDPVILAGDLNAVPESDVVSTLSTSWISATSNSDSPRLTFPSHKPERQLDYVLIRSTKMLRPVSSQVLAEAVVSDHRALLVELRLSTIE